MINIVGLTYVLLFAGMSLTYSLEHRSEYDQYWSNMTMYEDIQEGEYYVHLTDLNPYEK